jgi:hypothetical protein
VVDRERDVEFTERDATGKIVESKLLENEETQPPW